MGKLLILPLIGLFLLVLPAFVEATETEKTLSARLDVMNKGTVSAEISRFANLLQKSLASYEALSAYEGIFHKKESAGKRLAAEEMIYLRFEKPFKIFMGWKNTPKEGLQVVYERGRHNGKLAVHQPGLFFGLAAVVFLDQSSPWVREGSASYNIEDAGIGTFLFDFTECVLTAAQNKNLQVVFYPAKSSSQGPRAAVTFLNSKEDSVFFAYRVVIGFDSENHLPTHFMLFNWQNRPMGIYAYDNLKINPDPTDKEFLSQINRQLYSVYSGRR